MYGMHRGSLFGNSSDRHTTSSGSSRSEKGRANPKATNLRHQDIPNVSMQVVSSLFQGPNRQC